MLLLVWCLAGRLYCLSQRLPENTGLNKLGTVVGRYKGFLRKARIKKAINTKGGSIDGQLAGKRLLTIHAAYQEAAQMRRII